MYDLHRAISIGDVYGQLDQGKVRKLTKGHNSGKKAVKCDLGII